MTTTGLRQRFTWAYMLLVAGITPRCRDMTRLLSQGMDRPLPWLTRLRMRLHLTICVWCERYGEQMRVLRIFSRHFAERGCEHGETVLPPDARERLQEALRREPKP